jgi:DNA-binding transcriptional ArsR family regulator/uncharacterized protein YndB with AHSA1/START domain
MEAIFRALGDPHRRLLLDRLRERDGQTLAELDRHLPMTRFGTMKHLRVLEAAGLVTTRREGRRKLHYLNPVPIREIHDRWISKYAEKWAGALSRLKQHLEGPAMAPPRHVYTIFIRTSPQRLWEALTSPEDTKNYFYGTAVRSDWKPGSRVLYMYPNGTVAADGEVIESDPPRRLVTSFDARWDDEVAADAPHRVAWEIESVGPICRLTVTHDGFEGETATYRSVSGGVSVILSSLKSLLETGEPLAFPRP